MLRILHACWQEAEAGHIRQGSRSGEPQTSSAIITDSDDKVGGLPAEMAAALLLVSSERFSYADAAKVLDLPLNTLMLRLHQARKTLAAQLRKGAMRDLNAPSP
ncbi:RNA polymerase sigma factor [Cognatiyoonia sp. IB215182]|uniref:RNA polymerase sigma factor n=1 Tax=Cognatiyoonia sp. IB215182 TaxID=3097353 RepID=UPI002A0B8216|nr:sigma factor-like helix-turn-helix DNA-binding protein [Cognatiyoonia sp. IB215182]MDX8351409.1 sigma factor-like helix-turn-helix DNA-binding protein [Cognatiyoonia sp. IB215182]